jgi:hypothetical protein
VAGLPPLLGFGITALDLAMFWYYHNSKPRGSVNFRPGSNSNHGMHTMAQANSNRTTKPTVFLNAVARVHLSHLFQDPFLRAAFNAAEDDGLAPDLAEIDYPNTLDGGAAEVAPDTGRRVRALVEA